MEFGGRFSEILIIHDSKSEIVVCYGRKIGHILGSGHGYLGFGKSEGADQKRGEGAAQHFVWVGFSIFTTLITNMKPHGKC